jgi:hypothetical protein
MSFLDKIQSGFFGFGTFTVNDDDIGGIDDVFAGKGHHHQAYYDRTSHCQRKQSSS